jgi:fructose-bisphosphate aldolase class I
MAASLVTKYRDELIENANKIATPGKGILAADESTGTIGNRFSKINVENNEDNRRAYRELLFTTEGWENYCSGVILYEETLYQKAADGTPFVDILKKKGVLPGIKVDKGTVVIGGTDNETTTTGLDGLAARCQQYYTAGARFAKWRAVISIGANAPSEWAIMENAHGLARYAAICQENGLVPIIEPEVLMDGNHTIQRCAEVTQRVLAAVFRAANDQKIILEGALLKPNMVTPGQGHESYKTTTHQEIGHATVSVLQRTVPPAIPGIMFLSGGQGEEEASLNLNAINQHSGKKPWVLSFSYGRALQKSALDAWKGNKDHVKAGQAAFLVRAKANSEAVLGKYTGSGSAASNETLFQANYKY